MTFWYLKSCALTVFIRCDDLFCGIVIRRGVAIQHWLQYWLTLRHWLHCRPYYSIVVFPTLPSDYSAFVADQLLSVVCAFVHSELLHCDSDLLLFLVFSDYDCVQVTIDVAIDLFVGILFWYILLMFIVCCDGISSFVYSVPSAEYFILVPPVLQVLRDSIYYLHSHFCSFITVWPMMTYILFLIYIWYVMHSAVGIIDVDTVFRWHSPVETCYYRPDAIHSVRCVLVTFIRTVLLFIVDYICYLVFWNDCVFWLTYSVVMTVHCPFLILVF